MSILCESDTGWLICHQKFFDNLQVEKLASKSSYQRFKVNPDFFQISDPFKETISKQRRKCCETSEHVQNLFETFKTNPDFSRIFGMKKPKNSRADETDLHCKPSLDTKVWPRSNFKAVQAVDNFFEHVKDLKLPEFRGANPSEYSVISSVSGQNSKKDGDCDGGHRFIFPPNSKFYCKDVSEMRATLVCGEEEKFDLIIMDPPWWNKFIRRKKRKQFEAGYQMLDNDSLRKLPVKDILADNGVIVIWCTNAGSHHEAVQKFFQSWDVHLHHKMYWLKVTTSGLPICPFNEQNKKQPYEMIFIGGKGDSPKNLNTDKQLVVSVPSSINSHKPPLIEVVERLYPDRLFRKKLEIFARYLQPNFTSFGNEVIKLQHLSLFVESE